MSFLSRATVCGCAILTIVASAVVSATLGGDRSSIDTDLARTKGALMRVSTVGPYSVHEMRSAPGTTIREYVSTSGSVFGVAWDGPWLPDMRQLLGTHFEAYQAAAAAAQRARHGHGPLVVETPDFVVHSSGRAQAFSGRAYLPRLLPPGVEPESVQ